MTLRRKRGRPHSGLPSLVVDTMLGVLAPRPGRPSIAGSYKGAAKIAYAARIAAQRCGLKSGTCADYYRRYINEGGETPEQLSHRLYGGLLDVGAADPYSASEATAMNAAAAQALRRPLVKKKTPNQIDG